jgi:hypothetical protein
VWFGVELVLSLIKYVCDRGLGCMKKFKIFPGRFAAEFSPVRE